MNTEDFLPLIPQYLDGRLTPLERDAFERRLTGDSALRDELEALRPVWQGLELLTQEQPSAALRARFYQKLHSAARPRPTLAKNRWAIAAMFAAFAIGMLADRSLDRASASPGEIAQLHAELRGMREMVALSLLDRQSATARLEGVSWGSRADRSDRTVSTALLTALNHDPNVNVRLSSVDALQKFASDASIREALVDSIAVQESPLVQIALVDALVQIGDREAAPELRRLAHDSQLNANVRGRAQWALQRLGI